MLPQWTALSWWGSVRGLSPIMGAVAALLLVVVWLWTQPSAPGSLTLANGDTATTAINEISVYALPDGSTITVNADSVVRVDFARAQRRVVLERGQAFFEVRSDRSKPFVVAAGLRNITVTGTQFDVRYDSSARPVQVAVVEGHVKVAANTTADAAETALYAGDAMAFREGLSPVRLQLDSRRLSAWRERQLHFEESTLGEVLADVNRYTEKRLVLADAQLADLPISASFRAGDVDAVLFTLRELYKIEASDRGDRWELIRSAAVPTTASPSNR